MEKRHFDFVVIGGGSAGYAAARTARETLENVAIIDESEELGGLCILRGSLPKRPFQLASGTSWVFFLWRLRSAQRRLWFLSRGTLPSFSASSS